MESIGIGSPIFRPSKRSRVAFCFLHLLFTHIIVIEITRIKSVPPATESPMIDVVFSCVATEPPGGALPFWRLYRMLEEAVVGDGAILGLSGAFKKRRC